MRAIDTNGTLVTFKSGPSSLTDLERQTLEGEFGAGLAASLCTAVSSLRAVVLRLAAADSSRARLLQLGIAHGYKRTYVQTIISQILPATIGKKRKPGAGPKTPKLAYALLAFARELVGEQARKYLLAAAHLAKIEDGRRIALVVGQPARSSCYGDNRVTLAVAEFNESKAL